jgi:signal transduction histidine kinase
MVFADISAYKAAQDKAVAALKRAGTAERNLVNVGEEVQRRIGRELHDDLGQHLAGAAFMSEVLFQKLKDAGAEEMHDAAKITAMVNESITRRYLSQGLFPDELKESGFHEMMEKLAAYVEATHQIVCEFQCDCDCIVDNPDVAIHLFRISQEAVSNAIRHGHARHVRIQMTAHEMWKTLTIEDDGCGVGEATGTHQGGGLGMRTMQYRADLIGATFNICVQRWAGLASRCKWRDEWTNDAAGRKSKVMVVDDHPIVRQGMMLINREADMQHAAKPRRSSRLSG